MVYYNIEERLFHFQLYLDINGLTKNQLVIIVQLLTIVIYLNTIMKLLSYSNGWLK